MRALDDVICSRAVQLLQSSAEESAGSKRRIDELEEHVRADDDIMIMICDVDDVLRSSI